MSTSGPTAPRSVGFDVTGPLPTGTTVLEASAGTGKTWTIAALAARYVAEGQVTLPQLMLVTFGRAATRELRERVRERLVVVERGLTDPAVARVDTDPVLSFLAAVDDAEVARRRTRLAHALAHFDAATIATTHEFCQEMLGGLGVAGDADPDARFVEQIDDLLDEVVDDFFVRAYARPTAGSPEVDRATAGRIARAAVNDPEAALAPVAGEAEGTVAETRARLARAVRTEMEARKRAGRLYTFDDMLTRLDAALTDTVLGEAACRRLRSRFRVVLVDEFQDTDPIQWRILRTAFHGHAALTLIGDPKQAIYAFRGADVVSYLDAGDVAGTRATLDTNFRSDAPVLAGLDTLLGEAALGDPRIRVAPVAAHHTGRRLAGAPALSPVRLRVVPRVKLPLNYSGLPQVEPLRAGIARDLAADVAALLAAESTWDGRSLEPDDVAVLVRTNAQATLVRDALGAAGIPAVVGTASSVFAAEGAQDWLTLLEAVESPGRTARVRAVALTDFLGRRAAELDADPESVLTECGELLRRWGAVLRDRGVAAFFEVISGRTHLADRLLARPGGERRLTDLRHIGQVLHAEAADRRLGVVALAEWLRLRIAEARGGAMEPRPERSRRLESDADAVQIHTVHKCKGLEFPVVYVPFGWDRWVNDKPEDVLHHDADGRRVRAVGGVTDPAWKDHLAAAHAEDDGEDLRLLYVALTRAQGQLVVWWAPSGNTPASAVHRLFVGRPARGAGPPATVEVPADAAAWEALSGLAGEHLSVERVEARSAASYMPPAATVITLAASSFDRPLDLHWRRSSYSSLTAAAHDAPAGRGATSEPEDATLADEGDLEIPPAPAGSAVPSPMADLPPGTSFGTLVHAVLETVDTTGPDLSAALTDAATEQLARRPLAGVDAPALARALVPVMRTPLAPGWSLADVTPADRLAELDFELPLAGGDTPVPDSARVTLAAAAALLRRHLPAGDALAAYPDALEGLDDRELRGYLTGSIDAVLRAPDGRFVVVDYKTNWLGPIGPTGPDPLTSAHYGPRQLATAMIRAHYPLQAMLYGVALHRFLRWRLRGYEPDRHLGGSRYLFLRGMCGPDTPTVDGAPCGVFAWTPPPALTVALSDLLDGATADPAGRRAS